MKKLELPAKQPDMGKQTVELIVQEGLFDGLAKQNMLFHQCIRELVDNALASIDHPKKFKIDIILHKKTNDITTVYVADNGKGMTVATFKEALKPGKSATTTNRLNEHGFGLKNALATLSVGTNSWRIWSKDFETNKISSVDGPFQSTMEVEDDDTFPLLDFFTTEDVSTLIEVDVKTSFLQTLQGRGAKSSDLGKLRLWLIEHLGVFYRGYLEQDKDTLEIDGRINVSIDNDTLQVPPIPVPMGKREIEYFDVELGGTMQKIEYHRGVLDRIRTETLVKGQKAKYYYQGNQATQGIDIRLGKRVIATQQLETIWHSEDEENPKGLSRHNKFNDFVGELLIPELPRGVLTTTNTKTDFNLLDEDWHKLFMHLKTFKPTEEARNKSETELRKKWMKMIKGTNPDDDVSDNISVWPTGVKIDVYRKTKNGEIIIYELKVGSAGPFDLYQLKMYWDGLVLEGQQPKEGVLLVESFATNIEAMANLMNTCPPPNDSKKYNFKVESYIAKGL